METQRCVTTIIALRSQNFHQKNMLVRELPYKRFQEAASSKSST